MQPEYYLRSFSWYVPNLHLLLLGLSEAQNDNGPCTKCVHLVRVKRQTMGAARTTRSRQQHDRVSLVGLFGREYSSGRCQSPHLPRAIDHTTTTVSTPKTI